MGIPLQAFTAFAGRFRVPCFVFGGSDAFRFTASQFCEGGTFVNKSELVEHIAKQADISKAAAQRALDAFIGGVKSTLKKNGSVSLVGFGSFAVTKRAARTGRNPRTNTPIKIKAAKVPKFRPGKALKEALN